MKNIILAAALAASFAAPALALPADFDADAAWAKHLVQHDCLSAAPAAQLPETVTQNDVQPLTRQQIRHLFCREIGAMPAGAGTAEKRAAIERVEAELLPFTEQIMRSVMQGALKKAFPKQP